MFFGRVLAPFVEATAKSTIVQLTGAICAGWLTVNRACAPTGMQTSFGEEVGTSFGRVEVGREKSKGVEVSGIRWYSETISLGSRGLISCFRRMMLLVPFERFLRDTKADSGVKIIRGDGETEFQRVLGRFRQAIDRRTQLVFCNFPQVNGCAAGGLPMLEATAPAARGHGNDLFQDLDLHIGQGSNFWVASLSPRRLPPPFRVKELFQDVARPLLRPEMYHFKRTLKS